MPTTPPARRWLTIPEAAEYLGVSPVTIRRMISRGVLPGHRLKGARVVRIDVHDLDAQLRPIPTTSGGS